jgi:hypothetical protein
MEGKSLLRSDDDDDSGYKEVELMDPVGTDTDAVQQKVNDLKISDVNVQINALQWLMEFTSAGGSSVTTAHEAGGLKDLILLSESDNNDVQRLASGIIFNLSENPEVIFHLQGLDPSLSLSLFAPRPAPLSPLPPSPRFKVRESMEKMQIHNIKLKPEFGRAKTLTDKDVKQLQAILRRDPIDGGSIIHARNLKQQLKNSYKPPILCDGYLKCMKDNMMWKDYYVILSGPVLLMYNDKSDSTPKRVLPVGYCMSDELPGRCVCFAHFTACSA